MKVIIRALFLVACIWQSAALAHQGHNEITSETALNIASKSVQQLTFKDFGYQVGKLDASWKSATDAHFSVIEVLEKSFIVSATNTPKSEIIYFEIAKNGQVLGVKGTH
tara:strand:+ start:147 stop:473 length:327 start_codon:yes stop_codon:yes gene_type:complete